MTDLRARLADALADGLESKRGAKLSIPLARGNVAEHLADVLLSLPGIAIVESEMLRDAAEFIDREAGSQFSHDLAAALLAAADAAEAK